MKKYYLHDGQKQDGPFSLDELKQLGLKPNDMVWYEGLDDWKEANNIPNLKPILNTPPPFKKSSPPPFSNKSNNKSYLKYIGIIVLLMGGLLFYVNQPTYNYRPSEYEKSTVKETIKEMKQDEAKLHYRNNIHKYLNPHPNNYKKNLITGGIWDLEVKMDNRSPYTLDRVDVQVQYRKANGEVYQSKYVTFYNLKPKERYIKGAPNSEKGVEVVCYVQAVACKELGLRIN